MNKSEISDEVEDFLREARELIANDQIFLVPREQNLLWFEELEITIEQLWEIIGRLTLNNYSAGPDEARDGSGTYLWIFGGTVEKQATYIKLKIEEHRRGKILKCLSFHAAQFALSYPLRP